MSLEVCAMTKHFGGFAAVRGVSFEVKPGECVAMIGPNGAGKSTTFACIAGQLALTAGEVRWAGLRLDQLQPVQRLKAGVVRTFQVAQVFEALTVLQNVQLGRLHTTRTVVWDKLDESAPEAARAALALVGLLGSAHLRAADLPYGAKKRLELAIALAGVETATGETLILLDEPAAGLAPSERTALMQLVQSLSRPQIGHAGFAVLYTEHNMDAVFGVADRVLVLIDGQLAAQGTPSEVAENPIVRSRYLGRTRLAGLEACGA